MVRAPICISAVFASLAASSADAQVFTIRAEAPEAVQPGEVFTVEFWGQVEAGVFVPGVSAMAGFGIDAIGDGAVTEVVSVEIAEWAAGFGWIGAIVGDDVIGVAGGQLGAQFGLPFEGDFSHPIMLFTIEIRAGSQGDIAYTPANPNPNGGLSYYPDVQDGASIIAPNDPGTTLVLEGATTRVVPAPMPVLLVIGAVVAWPLARRRNAGTEDEA